MRCGLFVVGWVGWGWLAVDLLDSYWLKYSKMKIFGVSKHAARERAIA